MFSGNGNSKVLRTDRHRWVGARDACASKKGIYRSFSSIVSKWTKHIRSFDNWLGSGFSHSETIFLRKIRNFGRIFPSSWSSFLDVWEQSTSNYWREPSGPSRFPPQGKLSMEPREARVGGACLMFYIHVFLVGICVLLYIFFLYFSFLYLVFPLPMECSGRFFRPDDTLSDQRSFVW